MKKRLVKAAAGAVCVAVLITGCQKTPEAPLVAQKKSAAQARTVEDSDDLTIAGQVQAPEQYQAELEQAGSLLKVHVDAKMVIPEGKGFKLKKAEGKTFTQEDVDKQMEVLMKNAELTRRVYNDNDPAQGMTRAEAEEQISYIKAMMAMEEYTDEVEQQGLKEALKDLEKVLKTAPETAETEKVEPLLKKEKGFKDESMYGDGVVDGVRYSFMVNNYLEKDWRLVSAGVNRTDDESFYFEIANDDKEGQELEEKFDRAEIEKQAGELLEKLGISGYDIAAREPLATYQDEIHEKLGRAKRERAFGLYLTRTIDGIPVTYTNELGGQPEDTGVDTSGNEAEEVVSYDDEKSIDNNAVFAVPWPYERLEFIYDAAGLYSFSWQNPEAVSDLSDEYVFLLPFEDIRKVFEEMIFVKNADMTTEYCEKAEYKVYEVRLGYMRVMEKGQDGVGTMIPVWDFFGTREIHYKPFDELEDNGKQRVMMVGNEPNKVIEERPFHSLLTISAVDGSVIDRGLGY